MFNIRCNTGVYLRLRRDLTNSHSLGCVSPETACKVEEGIDAPLKTSSSTVLWKKVINEVRMKVNWGLSYSVVLLCVRVRARARVS